jgi:phosphoenolpyruvate synthase/pyruvate phosphate dikinase
MQIQTEIRSSADGEGTENIDICEEDRKKLCMSGDLFLKLAQIGVALERLFGSPRDIEWAVVEVICKGYA